MIGSKRFNLILKYVLELILCRPQIYKIICKTRKDYKRGERFRQKIDNYGVLQRHAQYDNYKDRLCVPMRSSEQCVCGIAIPWRTKLDKMLIKFYSF